MVRRVGGEWDTLRPRSKVLTSRTHRQTPQLNVQWGEKPFFIPPSLFNPFINFFPLACQQQIGEPLVTLR